MYFREKTIENSYSASLLTSPHRIPFIFYFIFLGLHPWQMEVPRLGVKLELQLPTYATVTAMQDPSHNSRQCQILNLLRGARDGIHVLMDTSWVHYHWATRGTPGSLWKNNNTLGKINLPLFINILQRIIYTFWLPKIWATQGSSFRIAYQIGGYQRLISSN